MVGHFKDSWFCTAQQGYILVPGFKVCNAAWSGIIYIGRTFAKGRELAVLVVTFYTCRLTYLPSMSVSVHAAVRGEILALFKIRIISGPTYTIRK